MPTDTTPLKFQATSKQLAYPYSTILQAGPVSMRFVDGDLRDIRAGGEELIRRVTFNVRHHRWDTAEVRLDQLELTRLPDSFELHYTAACEIDGVIYNWTADITGSEDGTIAWHVAGSPRGEMTEVRRAGLNVLYHVDCVAGQPFETSHLDGTVVPRNFPALVPEHHLPAMDFLRIEHTTREGAKVSVKVEGSQFGLEDQRVAGDDSFKAFSGLRHNYAPLAIGDAKEETVTIQVRDIAQIVQPSIVSVTLKSDTGTHRMPALEFAKHKDDYGVFHELTRRPAARNGIFLDVNLATEKSHSAMELTWGWYPNINLYDDETLMENVGSCAGQIRTAKQFAPNAHIRIDPISIDSIHLRAVPRDPRNDTPFAAAWMVAAAKHLALGGADEAAFAMDGSYARVTLEVLAANPGATLRNAIITSPVPSTIEAFSLESPGWMAVWIVNLTGETRSAVVSGLLPMAAYQVHRLNAATGPRWLEVPGDFTYAEGQTGVRLAPLEVCRLQFSSDPE